uniref:Putative lipid phosphate phosphatase 2 isoform X2 n=1 Tax=Davidia involucrata TaxID=16924 RepID=A0A5B7CC89_DAVIN
MREAQLGSHTVRSHGVTVARTHMHDWLILMLLVAIDVILNVINPFYRFVGKDLMTDLKYPLKDNTVPLWAVPLYAVLLPIAIFLLFYFRRRDVYDLHHAILGLLFSVLVTGVITDAIKDAVGRPRPNFFWRCFPDGKDVYDQWGNVACHGDKSIVKEGHKSFPSGHTSCWGPYAYFRILEESRGTTQAANAVNSHNAQATGAQNENQQDERNNNAFTGISLSDNLSLTVEDLESGRR